MTIGGFRLCQDPAVPYQYRQDFHGFSPCLLSFLFSIVYLIPDHFSTDSVISCWTFCALSLCCISAIVGLFTSQRCFCGDVLVPSIIITATESETTRACNVAGVASSLIHPQREPLTTPPVSHLRVAFPCL